MKLIECYVENFGKLQRYSHSFSDGLDVIVADNGWGKSTLAAFIKAMLYGLPSNGKKSIGESDRKKYMPWNGGRFGGYCVFEASGKVYRVERFFGKTPKDDTFLLTDVGSGKESRDFSASLGDGLFGIDADGYERTTFVPQKEFKEQMDNDSVRAKLTNSNGFEADMSDWKDADSVLGEAEKKHLRNRGKAGKIYEIIAKIDEVRKELDESDEAKRKLLELESSIERFAGDKDRYEKDLQDIEKQIFDAAEAQTLEARYSDYLNRKKTVEDIETDIEKAEKFFGEFPAEEKDVKDIEKKNIQKLQYEKEYAHKVKELADRQEKIKVSADEYGELAGSFDGREPDLDRAERLGREYLKLHAEAEAVKNIQMPVSEQRAAELEGHFSELLPTEQEMSDIRSVNEKMRVCAEKIRQYSEPEGFEDHRRRFGNEIPSQQTLLEMIGLVGSGVGRKDGETRSKSKTRPIMRVASLILMLAAGVGIALGILAISIMLIVGIVVGVVGVGLLVASFFVLADRSEISETDSDAFSTVDEFLEKYGMLDKSNRFGMLTQLSLMAEQYRTMLLAKNDIESRKREYSEYSRRIVEFAKFCGYDSDGDGQILSLIERDISDYRRLLASRKAREENMSRANRALCEKEAEIRNALGELYDVYKQKILKESDTYEETAVLTDMISVAKKDFGRYMSLKADVEIRCKEVLEERQRLEYLKAEQQKLQTEIEAFLSRYYEHPLPSIEDALQAVRENITNLCNWRSQHEQKKSELDVFIKDNRFKLDEKGEVVELLSVEKADADELKARREQLTESLRVTEREIQLLQKDAEPLRRSVESRPDSERELGLLKESKSELEERLDTLSKAREYLARAKESMTSKYLARVRGGFDKYLRMLVGDGLAATVDIDFSVTFEEGGERKLLDFYSRGYKDLVDICLRFALLDALYEGERPFVVLDDPFSNLDDKKILCAERLLRELSKYYQIIYFTCSRSRDMAVS